MSEKYGQKYGKTCVYRCEVNSKRSKEFKDNLVKQIELFKKEYCKENQINEDRIDAKINEIIGDKIGVTAKTIFKWRNGENFPSMEYIIKLTEVLNTTVDELLTGKNPYQNYLSLLEEKGFSDKALEIINKEIRAVIPKPLFKVASSVESLKIDFFTTLNYIIENDEKYLSELIKDGIQITEAYNKLIDVDKYKTMLESIEYKPFDSNNIEYRGQEKYYYEVIYNEFKEKLPDEIKKLLNDAEESMNTNYNMYKYDYMRYLFYKVYNNKNK